MRGAHCNLDRRYYTGVFPESGQLYAPGTYLHTHEEHVESFLFAATPGAAGLGVAPFALEKSCVPTIMKHTASRNITHMKSALAHTCPECFGAKLVCEARGGKTFCKDRHFNRGEPFTSLSFFASNEPILEPKVQHIVWFLRYLADEGVSPLTWNIYTDTFMPDDPYVWSTTHIEFVYWYYVRQSIVGLLRPVLVSDCIAPLERAAMVEETKALAMAALAVAALAVAGLAGALVVAARKKRRAAML
mmetsp:Transcript_45149/g.125218  ORF Transcript_45149/g.125218 Transcript_45149/m.125218 type:complete len:246 (+) Transcript_45149:1060-1797(+)|eukprot:6538975-Prymnesium_polylepis.1